jgi:hypothetical protein
MRLSSCISVAPLQSGDDGQQLFVVFAAHRTRAVRDVANVNHSLPSTR